MRTIGGLLALAALALVLPASAARLPVLASRDWWPVYSPDGTKIAFTNVNGQGRVFTLDVVDVRTKRVTRLAQASSQLLPSWSPDSKRIAYQSGGRVWTVGVDGTGRRATFTGGAPAWSPDGATIAYVSRGALYAGTMLVARNVIGVPSWSPDSRQLAFARSDGVYAAPVAGPERKLAPSRLEPRFVAWSPDGARVAYTDGGAIYVVRGDASSRPVEAAGPFAAVGPPAWTPASDAVAYTVRGAVELTFLDPTPHTSRLVAGAAVGTSFAPGDPHGDVLAYAGPNPHCSGHDAIRLFLDNAVKPVVAGSCEIVGTAGADVVEGTRPGGDVIAAGAGNDTVRARNGHPDRVDCGPGRDTVYADRRDRLARCERVL